MFFRARTPFVRGLALFLAAQPMLWMSNVALAQTLDAAALQARQAEAAKGGGSTLDAATADPTRAGGTPGAPGVPMDPFGSLRTATTPPPVGSTATHLEGDANRGEASRTDPGRLLGPQATPSFPVDEPLDPERYVLGPNDVLELHFWGVESFRLKVTVDLEGRAFIPRIGYLPLQGKTLAQAKETLREAVARLYPRLGFGMNLVEPRTFLVQVADDVARPGSYPAKGIDRVAAVIQKAGGLGRNASLRRIEVKRRDGTTVRADLLLYLLTGDVKHNPYVLDGDVIRVPFQSLVASIDGAVNRPGRYELVGSADLAELVFLAGGLSPGATRGLPVSVVRRGGDESLKRVSFDFPSDGALPTVAIQGDDAVWIPAYSEIQVSVTVTGALAGVAATAGVAGTTTALGASGGGGAGTDEAATRRLPYAQGDTVRTLIERVGGVGPLADMKGAYILRSGEAIPVDLYALVMLRDIRADKPVQLGDTVVIPFKRPNVLIEGAVFKPGPYPYNPTYSVEQYLALAGGPNRFAQDTSNVYMVTPDGKTREFAPDLKVEPGASLVVPERGFSRSEVVAIVLAGAGLLLSAVTIFITLKK
jgi:polysaccharide biosynthesis/export protein